MSEKKEFLELMQSYNSVKKSHDEMMDNFKRVELPLVKYLVRILDIYNSTIKNSLGDTHVHVYVDDLLQNTPEEFPNLDYEPSNGRFFSFVEPKNDCYLEVLYYKDAYDEQYAWKIRKEFIGKTDEEIRQIAKRDIMRRIENVLESKVEELTNLGKEVESLNLLKRKVDCSNVQTDKE